jgi:hypothetical protein
MIYQLVRQLQEKAIPVTQSFHVFAVSRSAEPLLHKTSVHLNAEFKVSPHNCGSRRLATAMQIRASRSDDTRSAV